LQYIFRIFIFFPIFICYCLYCLYHIILTYIFVIFHPRILYLWILNENNAIRLEIKISNEKQVRKRQRYTFIFLNRIIPEDNGNEHISNPYLLLDHSITKVPSRTRCYLSAYILFFSTCIICTK